MPRAFPQSTAELVIAAVNAVVASNEPATSGFVSLFADISASHSQAALELAVDLGLLTETSGFYSVSNPFCHFFATPQGYQKASVLRVVLESYEPFTVFRTRLAATGDTSTAAQETKALLDLAAHREEIKDTLLSLGQFSQALLVEAGGRYRIESLSLANDLVVLAQACSDIVSAEARIREQIGGDAAGFVSVPDVLAPMSRSLVHAVSSDPRSAVLNAGNAVDSFLTEIAGKLGVSLAGKGINQKLDELRRLKSLPVKLLFVGQFLGHVRNAADHGIDSDVGATWRIRNNTGLEYRICRLLVSRWRLCVDDWETTRAIAAPTVLCFYASNRSHQPSHQPQTYLPMLLAPDGQPSKWHRFSLTPVFRESCSRNELTQSLRAKRKSHRC